MEMHGRLKWICDLRRNGFLPPVLNINTRVHMLKSH